MTIWTGFDRLFPNALPAVLTFVILIFLCSLTIRAGARKKENRLFSLFCIFQIALMFSLIISFSVRSPSLILIWARITHLCYVFFAPVLVHYIHSALEIRRGKASIRLIYGLSMIAVLFTQSRYYFSGVIETPYGMFPKAGPALVFFGGLAVFCFAIYTWITAMIYREASRKGNTVIRMKSGYILMGLMPTMFLTMMNCLTLMGMDIYPMGCFGFIPMSIFTYGVLRHEILENRGWFTYSHIPDFLTGLIWTPLILSMIFCGVFSRTILEPNVMERLMTTALPAVMSLDRKSVV
jgi:hypothetical protein